jgi:hypothetical protein
VLGWALRIRWLWLEKTESSHSWAGLPIQVSQNAHVMFNVAVQTSVGNGESMKFWMGRWLNGKTIGELASNLLMAIPKRAIKQRTVAQALNARCWVADIKGALTVQILIEYLRDLVNDFRLQPELEETHKWRFSQPGQYSSKSVYIAYFNEIIKFAPWK